MDHLTYNYFDTMENLRNTLKLLVVRDPWERLLSAYRDKLEAGNTDDQQAFQETYGKDMVAKYRGEGLLRFGEEFYANNLGAPVAVQGRTLNEPTFWEFVQAIIREGGNSLQYSVERYRKPQELLTVTGTLTTSTVTFVMCSLM